jgi:hypothetical protein
MTFDHGVAGASPAALTKEIKYLVGLSDICQSGLCLRYGLQIDCRSHKAVFHTPLCESGIATLLRYGKQGGV